MFTPWAMCFLFILRQRGGEREDKEWTQPCLSSAVKQTRASCTRREQAYRSDKLPHFPCCLAAGTYFMNSVTTELWPVAFRLPEGMPSHFLSRVWCRYAKRKRFFCTGIHVHAHGLMALSILPPGMTENRQKGRSVSDKRPIDWGEKWRLPSWEIKSDSLAIIT